MTMKTAMPKKRYAHPHEYTAEDAVREAELFNKELFFYAQLAGAAVIGFVAGLIVRGWI